MKTLYLVRHGETLFNTQGKVQGWCDSPLTERGRAQAASVRRYLEAEGVQLDHAYCSTQERACDTLEIACDLPYTRLKGIKEMNFGEFEGAPGYLQPHGPAWYETFYEQFGGESASQVSARMIGTLREVMEKGDHQNVIAVSHNGSIFYFLRDVWREEFGEQPIQLPNCAVLVFDFSKEDGFVFRKLVDPANY